jgi:hypothetical protein
MTYEIKRQKDLQDEYIRLAEKSRRKAREHGKQLVKLKKEEKVLRKRDCSGKFVPTIY